MNKLSNTKRLKNTVFATLMVLSVSSVSASENYTVPDSYTPVSVWADGITPEQFRDYRANYRSKDFASGNDLGTFSYLHMNEVITTATVQRAGQVAPFKQSPLPAIADTVATTKIGTLPLSKAIADNRSRMQGIAVVHKGKLVFEQYPGMQAHQKHVWSSSAKTITGLLVHMLNTEGKLDLSKTTADYLPEFKGTQVGSITLANLLHHRSGLDIIETQPNMEDPDHPLGRGIAAAMSARGEASGETISDVLRDVKPLRTDQGLVFDYSTLNTQVLGLIIERVTGKPWNQVASQHLWSKIGMENDAMVGLSAAGDVLNGGIFSSTLRDFARYATIYTPSWKAVSDTQLVKPDYFTKVFNATDIEVFNKGEQGKRMTATFGTDSGLVGSSYKWDALFKDGDMYKAGLGGQGIYLSPETDTAIVWFSSTYRNSFSMAEYARAIVEQNFR